MRKIVWFCLKVALFKQMMLHSTADQLTSKYCPKRVGKVQKAKRPRFSYMFCGHFVILSHTEFSAITRNTKHPSWRCTEDRWFDLRLDAIRLKATHKAFHLAANGAPCQARARHHLVAGWKFWDLVWWMCDLSLPWNLDIEVTEKLPVSLDVLSKAYVLSLHLPFGKHKKQLGEQQRITQIR